MMKLRNIFSFCLLSALIFVSGCASPSGEFASMLSEQARQTRMDRSRLNIGAYILDDYARTEGHIKDIADCDVDFIVCLYIGEGKGAVLDTFAKHGLGADVTGVLSGWWGGDGSKAGKMAEINPMERYRQEAAAFQDHPAIWCVDLGDEPSALDFPYYGQVARFAQKAFPNQIPYLNLYPNYASVAANNAVQTVNQLGTATYQEYIDEYCKYVGLDYICYDYYPYSAGYPRYFENQRIVANACRNTGRSLWIVLQVNSDKADIFLSENQLRAQAFSSMAYGAENIIWACWTAGWWHNQVLDKQGNKTEQYDKLKKVNAEIRAFAGEYMRFRNTATHFVGFPKDHKALSKLQDTTPVDALSTGVFFDVKGSAPLLVGQMTPRKEGSGERALWIFAADDLLDEHNQEVTVSFRCPERTVWAIGAEFFPAGEDTYTLKLRSNGAAMLIAE